MMGVVKEPSIQSIVMPNVAMSSVLKLSVFFTVCCKRALCYEHCFAECRNAKRHTTECRGAGHRGVTVRFVVVVSVGARTFSPGGGGGEFGDMGRGKKASATK
jgi:hypothetical protein